MVGVALAAWMRFPYAVPIAMMVLAPVVLLRTPESEALALRIYSRFQRIVRSYDFNLAHLDGIASRHKINVSRLRTRYIRRVRSTSRALRLYLALRTFGTVGVILVGICVIPSCAIILWPAILSGDEWLFPCCLITVGFLIAMLLTVYGASTFTGTNSFLVVCPIRLYATVLVIIRRRGRVLHVVPTNWFRVCVCQDTMHPAELLPGASRRRSFSDLTLLHLAHAQDPMLTFGARVGLVLLALCSMPLYYVPYIFVAYGYRLSLKSTSLIWLPLIWVLTPPPPGMSLRHLLVDLSETARARLRAAVALFGLSITVAIAYAIIASQRFALWIAGLESTTVAVPASLLGLHTVNWALTRLIFDRADRLKRHLDLLDQRPDERFFINEARERFLLRAGRRTTIVLSAIQLGITLWYVIMHVRIA